EVEGARQPRRVVEGAQHGLEGGLAIGLLEGLGVLDALDPGEDARAVGLGVELHPLDAGTEVERQDGPALGEAVAALPGEEVAAAGLKLRLVEIDDLPAAMLEGEEAIAEGGGERVGASLVRGVDRHDAELGGAALCDPAEPEVPHRQLEGVADEEQRRGAV